MPSTPRPRYSARQPGNEHAVPYDVLKPGPADVEVDEHSRVLAMTAQSSEDLRQASDYYVRQAAQAADLAAAAAALVAGKPDPGKPAETALDESVEALKRRVEVSQSALRRSYEALRSRVEATRSEWLTSLAAQREQAARDVDAALATVLPALAEYDRLRSVERLVDDLNGRKAYPGRPVTPSVQVPGTATSAPVAVLLAAVRGYLAPPEPASEPLLFVEGRGRVYEGGEPAEVSTLT